MAWGVIYFQTNRGEQRVKEFIKELDQRTQAKVLRHVDLLGEYGPFLGMPYAKKITTQLYELRTRGKEEVRIFYAFRNTTVILLHGFKKQTQKTPAREIAIAASRFQILDTT